MSLQKIIVAASTGLAAGIIIGLLAAPMSGAETRQKIADSAEELKKKIRKFTGYAVDELEDLKEVFENQVEGLGDDVRERVLNLIEQAKASKNHLVAEASAN